MLRRVSVSILTIVILCLTVMPMLPSFAVIPAVSCDYDAINHRVTVTINDPQVSSFGLSVNLGGISSAGNLCGVATVNNTDRIKVVDAAGAGVSVGVDISEPFAPGFTDEPGESDEIEFDFQLGTGDDGIAITGTEVRDFIRVGLAVPDGPQRRINLNASEANGVDADVFSDTPLGKGVSLSGYGGRDVFKATGGRGTGGVFPSHVFMSGGDGVDRLIGGKGPDTIYGDGFACTQCDGNDIMHGGRGKDVMWGFGGGDSMFGGLGGDSLEGNDGNDSMRGEKGGDELLGQKGNDGLNGGAGVDTCKGGSGQNTRKNCEN